MTYELKDAHYLEEGSDKFFILFEFPNEEIYRISYEFIVKTYEEIIQKNKNNQKGNSQKAFNEKIMAEKINNINVLEIAQKELNVKFVDCDQQTFYFQLTDIRIEIQLYKKKRTIKVINKDDKEKEYEIYCEQQISYIQVKEGLTIKNSQIYDSKDNIITNINKIARIVYIKGKEDLNPFDKYKLKKANKK